jgi:hypothetical protein
LARNLVDIAATAAGIGGDVIATDPAIGPRLHRLLDGDVSLNFDTTSSAFGFLKASRVRQRDRRICARILQEVETLAAIKIARLTAQGLTRLSPG